MGRPKQGQKPERNPGSDERVAIIHLKGSPAYAEWLDGLHRKTHIAKSTLFRLGVAEIARQNGYPEPPEL